MCGSPRQLHGWFMPVSATVIPLVTLRGGADKLPHIQKPSASSARCAHGFTYLNEGAWFSRSIPH